MAKKNKTKEEIKELEVTNCDLQKDVLEGVVTNCNHPEEVIANCDNLEPVANSCLVKRPIGPSGDQLVEYV